MTRAEYAAKVRKAVFHPMALEPHLSRRDRAQVLRVVLAEVFDEIERTADELRAAGVSQPTTNELLATLKAP